MCNDLASQVYVLLSLDLITLDRSINRPTREDRQTPWLPRPRLSGVPPPRRQPPPVSAMPRVAPRAALVRAPAPPRAARPTPPAPAPRLRPPASRLLPFRPSAPC